MNKGRRKSLINQRFQERKPEEKREKRQEKKQEKPLSLTSFIPVPTEQLIFLKKQDSDKK